MTNKAAGQESRIRYCTGCGQPLPSGKRGYFHKQCLQADKQRRTSEKRRRELERFRRFLQKQRCPNCGVRFGEFPAEPPKEALCEASQGAQQCDPPVTRRSRANAHQVPGSSGFVGRYRQDPTTAVRRTAIHCNSLKGNP
jgi:hypothetical protein